MSQQIIDLAIVYRIIKMLILDWKDMPAFKLGIIDENGKVLRQPKTQKEKDAYTVLNKLVFRLRRYLQKVPQFARDFITLAAAIQLVKECASREYEPSNLEQLFEEARGMVSTDDEKSLKTILESTEYIEFMLLEEIETHPMIEVDGVMKHRNNSNGVPIHHTDEGIRNFHRWFGNSKVVDKHGRPKVLYHGTTHDFSEFKPSKEGLLGAGIYLSDTKWHSGGYAVGDGGNVNPVYARLENPYSEHSFDDQTHDETHARKSKIYFGGNTDKILGDMGHDGIHHDLGNLQVFVAHHPSQVKSALGNNGGYSKESNVITEEGEGGGDTGGTALGSVPGNNTFADVAIPGTGDSKEVFVSSGKLFAKTVRRKPYKKKV